MDRSAEHDDIVLVLDTPDDLFMADPSRFLAGSGRLDSGMDELVERFLGQRRVRRRRQRLVLDLTAAESAPGLAERVEQAIRRYCDLRIERLIRQRDLMWRQGIRSLWTGSLLFFLGVALSIDFTGPDADPFWRELLGNGFFLVVAWVGLWYPLDLLFIARQPLKREIRVLTEMKALPVVVLTRSTPTPTGAAP